jgi:dTDP-4-amino-4,6-dideoxygalactose transaminase
MTIAFIDLAAQQDRIRPQIEGAIARVLAAGQYISGPEVALFERQLESFCGAKHALGCANGTDALLLAVMALGIGKGDAVFVPSFTFAASAEVMPYVGATPFFVDVREDTFNLDIDSLKRSIVEARRQGLRPACVMPVDLFGLPADFDAINAIAQAEGMRVINDSAQGFGGSYHGRITGSFGDITTTSFFPAKPLGCYGDGGAVFTNDPELAALMESLRVHGKGSDKYDNVRVGMNSRLDTLQAAILIEKLAIYRDEIELRQKVADRYNVGLAGRFETPLIPDGLSSVWAQYTIKLESAAERDAVQARTKAAGIPTVVYYPMPLHRQTAYKHFPADPAGLPASEALGTRVLSLPMHPYLDEQQQDQIIATLVQ